MNNLAVSEVFYSIQGEGATTGVPAVFLRLGGCNLLCKSESWTCDTIEVWRKSTSVEFADVLSADEVDRLREGAHLVITGGEPLAHKVLGNYLFWFNLNYGFSPYIEVETNGTIEPPPYLRGIVHQWNCSPKLRSSGAADKRYNVDVLKSFACLNTYFKFVISSTEDANEVFRDYSFLPSSRLIFMPAGDTRELLEKTRPVVAEICKNSNVRYGDRLHIVLWDKKTGV